MGRVRKTVIGSPLPNAMVAIQENSEIVPVDIVDLARRGAVMIVGVPGAFTPVCTTTHLPSLVQHAGRLYRSGFNQILCVAASDPFTLAHWAHIVDPEGKISFVSDGNLNLARSLDLVCRADDLFMGPRSERYLINVKDGLIARLKVEAHYTAFDKTNPKKVYCEGCEEPSVSPNVPDESDNSVVFL